MPKTTQSANKAPARVQGTDGIRREVMRSTDPSLAGLTPQQAFLERGVITEEFMECYAYAHVTNLVDRKEAQAGDSFVVGWDPRDPEGLFTEAVVQGIRKAGLTALVVGIVPTPLVPMYVLYKNAVGGFMVTASHNPKDQNGIKTFLAYRGMKLLPDNDVELTRALLNLKSLNGKTLRGRRLDRRRQAVDLFMEFSLDPVNSWSEGVSFENVILVVDPARGSLSGLAAQVFNKAGFGQVVEVNPALNGEVNLRSGVADLEGHAFITADMVAKGSGIFSKHRAVLKLFELGRRHQKKIDSGTLRVCGAVFDADGDRFYRLDYHPDKDRLIVLSGDETAFLQAQFLKKKQPKVYRGAAYINTVESDLNAGVAAEKMGFQQGLSPVGDKWILLRIALLVAETRLARIKGSKASLQGLNKSLRALKKSGHFDVQSFQKLEKEMDQMEAKVGSDQEAGEFNIPFAVGSEETGHNITLGWMGTEAGKRLPVFFGNGLKSALNTFAATQTLLQGKKASAGFRTLERPFPSGFKETYYAYYIEKEKFCLDSTVWKQVKRTVQQGARQQKYGCRVVIYKEDPDMLYLALQGPGGSSAGIFIRNSGTENKISVNLRGGRGDMKALQQIGEEAIRFLMNTMKARDHHLYKVELDLLSQMATRPLAEETVKETDAKRVLHELGKQGLTRPSAQGFRLTERGKWYITSG